MIGLVVLTHGQMAAECLRSAEMIVGPIAGCRAISIDRSDSVDDATNALAAALSEVGSDDDGVLIITDMFGGTPTNIAANFLEVGKVDILTGLNLPLLIKATSCRQTMALDELSSFLCSYGQQAILRPAELLKRRS